MQWQWQWEYGSFPIADGAHESADSNAFRILAPDGATRADASPDHEPSEHSTGCDVRSDDATDAVHAGDLATRGRNATRGGRDGNWHRMGFGGCRSSS